ncbi:MAG: hypothetical protein ACOX7N_02805 [Lawsonibacter sp.]|jgi:hypothetical protein
MLNLGSIVLGLLAWSCPIWYLTRRTKGQNRGGWAYLISLGCCTTALWFQILYDAHLAKIQDVSAWMDTIDAVAKVSGFLLLTTLLVNVFVLWMDGKLEMELQQEKEEKPKEG